VLKVPLNSNQKTNHPTNSIKALKKAQKHKGPIRGLILTSYTTGLLTEPLLPLCQQWQHNMKIYVR